MLTGRVPPRKRTAIADPRGQATVEMHRGTIVTLVRARNRQIVGNDMRAGGEIVPEGDLDRLTLMSDDDAAEMTIVRPANSLVGL